jgi:methionine synthase II (cobalamin-independent)
MPLFHDESFRDVVLQSAIMKSVWQVRTFRPCGGRVICFVDEPVLSAFGSANYINLMRAQVVETLSRVAEALHREEAIMGVHVCGNSEWPILMDAGVDIINFDAYSYGPGMALYADRVTGFLENGGVLAWGVVPTDPIIHEESPAGLMHRLQELVKDLAGRGVPESLVWRRMMLTPSCGMGTMTEPDAERVIKVLGELATQVQQKLK